MDNFNFLPQWEAEGRVLFPSLEPLVLLSQDSSAVSGSQNVLDQTRRLLHSTGSSQSGRSGGQRDEPSLLQVPPQDTSNLGQLPAVPPPQLPQLRQKLGISLVG